MDTLPFTVDQVGFFFLVLVRVATIMQLLPIFGSQSIPVQIKIGFSLILTVLLFPTIMHGNPYFDQQFSLPFTLLLVVREVLIGLAIGYTASLLFAAVQFAGKLVDTEMGFAFVELMDPFTNERVTVWGQLQTILFTVLFLIMNGHFFFILAIQKSFEVIPLMAGHLPDERVITHLIGITGSIFVLALKFAAPIYVTLVLTEVALGVVARTVPQMNIFFVGMPLKIVVGLGAAVLSLPMLVTLFRFTVDGLVQNIWRLLYLMA